MPDSPSTEKIKYLKKKDVWSIGDITWIMLGHEDCSGHFDHRIMSPEPERDYGNLSDEGKACVDLLEKILDRFNSGHFGGLLIPFMSEFEEWHSIHRLRVVDWVNDTDILESVKFKQNHSPTTQKKILNLFETVNKKRPHQNDKVHEVDFAKLAQSGSWVLTELRIVLFGETYLGKYHSDFYQKFISEIEDKKKEVDELIEESVTLERIKEFKSKNYRQPLISYAEDGQDNINDRGYDVYVGVYDENEYMPEVSVYKPNELMKVLHEKGFPIPKELTEEVFNATDKNSLVPLLKSLRGEVQHWLERGCPIPAVDSPLDKLPPSPSTKQARKGFLKKKLIKVATSLLNKNPELQFPDFMSDSDTRGAIYESELSVGEQPAKSTYQKWLREARKQAGLSAPSGRPRKP